MPDLKKLRKSFGYTQKDMANILGIKQNAYSSIETGKVSLTDRNKSLISEKLGVNKDWLNEIVDEPMIKVEGSFHLTAEPEDEPPLNPSRENIHLNKVISELKQTRPRIPYTAAAGSLTSAVEGITADQCEQIPRINIFPEYDFTIIIKGNSMEPKYEGGDEVACKRIDSTSFIQWGKVHVLDTAQGILIKRVYENGDKIRCVSYNSEYPDFSIDKSDIYSMSLVVGLIRL
ncbi:XRE family transcriptional regulator [Bacteroides cellulosilyticus]|uniref:LexA family transcriptional regulator n=1 Tax=Bacteroides cellulosilyticus TaxID=246787 RepID=A0A642PUI0_9BACE|nr:XRE family transcriptional regulator [Bacteroides cellulosilyticus]KAA5415964.1 LexA family transcriptional regulator [Bacteroides cellulosilyticus]